MRPSRVTPWKPAMTAISPASMAAISFSGGMSSMRARPWASSVMIGICQPSQERALRPMLRRAMASRPAVTCSPEATTTSYSSSDDGRPCAAAPGAVGPGHQLIGLAGHGRDHHGDAWPAATSAATSRATRRMRSRSATEVPPNFITSRDTAIAAEWWDPQGKFAPLHKFNPVRLAFIREQGLRRFARDGGRARRSRACGCWISAAAAACCASPWRGWASRSPASTPRRATSRWRRPTPPITRSRSTIGRGRRRISWRPARRPSTSSSTWRSSSTSPTRAPFLRDCARLIAPGGLMIVATLNRTLKALALAKIGAARAHPGRLRGLRHRRREDQQAGGLSGCGVAQARLSLGGGDPELLGGRQVRSDGRGAGHDARRGAREVLGDDRAEPVLHGRDQPQAQDPGHRRGGRREPGELCVEAAAEPKASSPSPRPARTRPRGTW